jgi:hypothetical protein
MSVQAGHREVALAPGGRVLSWLEVQRIGTGLIGPRRRHIGSSGGKRLDAIEHNFPQLFDVLEHGIQLRGEPFQLPCIERQPCKACNVLDGFTRDGHSQLLLEIGVAQHDLLPANAVEIDHCLQVLAEAGQLAGKTLH